MPKLKFILIIFAAIFSLLTPSVLAADKELFGVCNDPSVKDEVKNSSVCKSQGTTKNPAVTVIRAAANVVALITGIGAVIAVIASGFMFVTAGGSPTGQRSGDPNRIKSARATLTAAVIGAVVVALAWAITRFVTDTVLQ